MTRTKLSAGLTILCLMGCIKQPEPKSKKAPAPAAAPAAGPEVAAAGGAFELKGDATKGATTFKTFCTPCHGDLGKGDAPAAAALNPKPADFTDAKRAALSTDEQLYGIVKEGGQSAGKSPLMTAWKGTLDDQQLRDVVAFVRTFSKPVEAAK